MAEVEAAEDRPDWRPTRPLSAGFTSSSEEDSSLSSSSSSSSSSSEDEGKRAFAGARLVMAAARDGRERVVGAGSGAAAAAALARRGGIKSRECWLVVKLRSTIQVDWLSGGGEVADFGVELLCLIDQNNTGTGLPPTRALAPSHPASPRSQPRLTPHSQIDRAGPRIRVPIHSAGHPLWLILVRSAQRKCHHRVRTSLHV